MNDSTRLTPDSLLVMPKRVQGVVFVLAGGLLLVDAALLLVHLLSARLGAWHLDPAWLVVHRWRVDADRGIPEVVQYLKLGLLVFGSLILYRRGSRGMLAFAVLFAVLLLDDWLQGHEQLGSFLAEKVSLSSVAGLAPYDVGELIAWLLLGGIFLGILLSALRSTHSAGWAGRRIIIISTMLIGVLALFGVVVDTFAALLQERSIRELAVVAFGAAPATVFDLTGSAAGGAPSLLSLTASLFDLLLAEPFARAVTDLRNTKVIWTLVEEGGEMLTMTLLVTYLWSQALPIRIMIDGPAGATPRRRRSVL